MVHMGITLRAGVGARLPESCGEVKWLARNQDSNPRQLAKCLGSDYWAQLPLPASLGKGVARQSCHLLSLKINDTARKYFITMNISLQSHDERTYEL